MPEALYHGRGPRALSSGAPRHGLDWRVAACILGARASQAVEQLEGAFDLVGDEDQAVAGACLLPAFQDRLALGCYGDRALCRWQVALEQQRKLQRLASPQI